MVSREKKERAEIGFTIALIPKPTAIVPNADAARRREELCESGWVGIFYIISAKSLLISVVDVLYFVQS